VNIQEIGAPGEVLISGLITRIEQRDQLACERIFGVGVR